MNINEFLNWLMTSAGSSLVAVFILDRIAWYANKAQEARQWIFFGVCSALSVGSYVILTYVPAAVLSQIAPFFALVAIAFSATFVGTAFNKLDRKLRGKAQ